MGATRSAVISLSVSPACVATIARPPPAQAASRWGADYFPDVPLTTQDGKVVHFHDDLIKGKSVVVDII